MPALFTSWIVLPSLSQPWPRGTCCRRPVSPCTFSPFSWEAPGITLGYDLALGPRLRGAALWAQQEIKARFGYDGTLVYIARSNQGVPR